MCGNRTYIRSLTVEIIVRHSVHHYRWFGGHFLFCSRHIYYCGDFDCFGSQLGRNELNWCSSWLSRTEQFCFSRHFSGYHLFKFSGRYIIWLTVSIIDVKVITVCRVQQIRPCTIQILKTLIFENYNVSCRVFS